MSSTPLQKLQSDLEAAMQYLQDEQLALARDRCNKILKQHPNQADALHILGLVAYDSNDAELAIDLIQRAIVQHDGMPAFHHHLAEIQRTQGNLNEAEIAYRRALELLPQYPEAMFGYANILVQFGRSIDAIDLYQQGLLLVPEDFGALCGLGQALATIGAFEPAIEVYAAALKQQPDSADLLIAMGLAQAQHGDVDTAVSTLNCAIKLHSHSVEAHNGLAKVMFDAGRVNEAIEHYQCVLKAEPDFAEAYVGLGVCLQQIGRFDEANAAYHRALEFKPDLVSAHYNLALSQSKSSESHASIDQLQSLLQNEPPVHDRIQLNFALGKRLDDTAYYDAAFTSYERANNLSKTQRFDVASYHKSIDKLIKVFTPALFKRNQDSGIDSALPILLIGMPRSGTTLIEQIIASHPNAHGAGELTDLSSIAQNMPAYLNTADDYPSCINQAGPELFKAPAETYLAKLREKSTEAERIVDKMPRNYMHLGLLGLMLPHAKIIHCRRNPLDTCVSCYFQNFEHQHDFSNDLETLGQVYNEYRRLMQHWRAALPMQMLEIDYEQLVNDPEPNIRKIIAFCGLDWDAVCLAPHQHDRQIHTASFWQARQPIYSSATVRWKHYEKHLGPLMAVLEAWS